MHYPIHLVRINECLSLYLPIQGEIKAVYEKTLTEAPHAPFPFWAKVWPASTALTRFLYENRELITGKNVLEIGAGTGIPSFSISGYAAAVIVSDHSTEAVALMEKNIALLGLSNVKAMCLDWNDFPETVKADTLLLSDINYAPDQFTPLLALIYRFLREGTIVVIATPQRLTGTSFLLQLGTYIRLNEVKNAEGVDISLLVLSEKSVD